MNIAARTFVCVGLLAILCGCAATAYPPYVAPTQGDKATLSLATAAAPVAVTAFDSYPCDGNAKGSTIANFQRNNAGDRLFGVDREIRAGKQFFLVSSYATGGAFSTGTFVNYIGRECSITLEFFPQTGRRYKAWFDVIGNRCVATIHRVVLDSNNQEKNEPELSFRQISNCR
jgi:hypothetical protein